MKKNFLITALVSSIWLSGCNTPAIYYEEWYNPPVHWGQHTVRDGETLYKIAWRYGRDYRELGSANNLTHPYTIEPGQKIRLDLKGTIPANKAVASSSNPSTRSNVTVYADDPDSNNVVPVKQEKKKISVPTLAENIEWEWPHMGNVAKDFSNKGMPVKGIDIIGAKGDAIKAAASGHVMYAGSGILGYGKMIIVGHDSKTFSVYAHNSELLVNEGDGVTRGQKIAEMGDSGADKVKLYFELRKNGKSVNPTDFLPEK